MYTASYKLLCFVGFILINGIKALPQFSLTPSNGTFCLGRAELTCTGTEVANGLIWRVNNTDHTPYTFQPLFNRSNFPQSVNLNPPIPSVQVWIIRASLNQNGGIDILSTLSGNASVLSGSMVQCISALNTTSNNVRVKVIRAPPLFSPTCSLVHTTGGPEVSIQWSPSFTSQYNVEMYRVVVNPATPSCSSDQMIGSSEGYSCSGLVLETCYSFNVSAINCGNQEGAESTITIQPQAPQTPEVTVLPLYDQNRRLNQLTVRWMQQTQPLSERCSFNQHLNYTVILEDSSWERVDQRMISSDNCTSRDNFCSISFPLSSPDQNYFIGINVTGAFGTTSTSLNITIPSSINVTASSEDCVASVLCSYPMREGNYFFQYGRDSSYQDLSPSLSTSLNFPFQITVSDAATIHYYQVTINNFRVRGNFTSGKGAQLTTANQGLLVVGVILLSVAIVLGVIITSIVFTKGPWLSLGLSMTGFVVTFVSLVLWVAVGFHVGLQKNTCDSTWQSSRDGLIISAHVFSDISLLIFVAAGIYFAVDYISLPNYKKRSSEQMSFWQKCLHRSLSISNQYKPRKEAWEVNKPSDGRELELGAGGRLKKLEDLTVGDFRKPGQSYMDAKLEIQERYYQEYKDELPTDGSKGEEPASKGKGEDSHYRPLDHGKGGSGRGHKDKPARETGGGEEYSALNSGRALPSGGPSPSQVHHDEEKDQHYLPLDNKKGGKVAGSKDKPSSTQGGSGGEYSALGNSKESGRKQAKPSPSQAHKMEGEHYLPLDHGKGDRSGRKDKPSSTQKGSGEEYSVINKNQGGELGNEA